MKVFITSLLWLVMCYYAIVEGKAKRAATVASLETLLEAQASTIQSLQARLDANDRIIHSLQALVVEQDVSIQQHSVSLQQQIATIISLQTQLHQHDTSIRNIHSDVTQHNVTLDTLVTNVHQHDVTEQGLQSEITRLDRSIQQHDAALTSVEDELGRQNVTVQSVGSVLEQLNVTLQGLHDPNQQVDNTMLHALQSQIQQQDLTNIQQAANLHDLHNQLHQQDLGVQDVVSQLQQQNASIQSLASQLLQPSDGSGQQAIQTLNKDLQALSAKQALKVGFQVDYGTEPYGYVHLSSGSPLKFDNVVTNVGNAYNQASGVFTTPYSGLYIFNLHLMGSHARNDTELGIYVKDVAVAVAYAKGDRVDDNDQGSCTTVLQLNGGWPVSVQFRNGYPEVWGSHLTSFSGVLLHAD